MYLKKILLIFITFFFSLSISSQCRGYTKKECLPKLDSYIHTGQLNSTKLKFGEKAEFLLTFYKGQEYRIIVCSEDIFDSINFKIRDRKRRLIYESLGEKNVTFNFKVASTQELIISFIVPETENTESTDIEGCISAIVGFKF